MTNGTTQLKIAFVLDDGLDKPDGVQQNILTLGKWLGAQGHSVSYLVGETKRTDINAIIPMSKNIKVKFNHNLLSIPLVTSGSKISKVLEEKKFDIVHVQVPYSPIMGARVLSKARNNSVIIGTFHIMPAGLPSRLGSKLLWASLYFNLKKFDRHLAVSEPARQFAQESYHINASVLPNPVNLSLYKTTKKPLSPKKVKMVFLGRLVKRKGCSELLQAIHILAKNNALEGRFHLHICGTGPMRSRLKKYVLENSLESYVTFHGFVSENDKIKHLQTADLAVFPSISGESFGIVLIEAMAAGATVLAGDNPGYESVLKELPESLFNPKDATEFTRKLKTYIGSKDNRLKLHNKQQKLVKKFDVEVVGKQLLAIYNDCIAKRKDR